MNASAETGRPASVTKLPTWVELNQQWLVAAISRLAERFETWKDNSTEPLTPIADRVETPAAGFTPALIHCARVFGLSAFERELLLLVAGLELDSRLRAAVAMRNGGASVRASYGLALATLTQPHWDALSPVAPLRYWRMVEPAVGHALTQAPLHIDERILHFISGIASGDAQLAGIAERIEAAANIDTEDRPLAKRIAELLAGESEPGSVVALYGNEQDFLGRRDLALVALAQAGRAALWLAARDLPVSAEAQWLLARHIDREAMLTDAVPVLCIDGTVGEGTAAAFVGRLCSALLWLGTQGHALLQLPRSRRVLRLELPRPDARRTRRMLASRWQQMAATTQGGGAVRAALDHAASQFHLDPAALENIVERLRVTPPAERAETVWHAAREAARGGLDALAQRVVTRASFADLVLPAGQDAMLRDIARQLRHRERVYREWGFGEQHQLGQGLVALFAGESGTGKTLAAEAIANEARLDLYRIDLATVVSKYIGETEKNLKRLFDAAEASGAVLLFDEADAIFGKRSEVKDSHDRYANIEVAYLLQRVEAYRGLAVLTTNMRSALDRAFLRRIRFVVTFPFPDAAARDQIWRLQFPQNAPLGEINFAALSRLNLSGGHIRSVAVNAAFKAADRGGIIDQAVLMEAVHEEFAKLERTLNSTGGAP